MSENKTTTKTKTKKTATKQPPKIVLPIKRRKEKPTNDNEENNNGLDALGGEKLDLNANVNIIERLSKHTKKPKKQPQPTKKQKKDGEESQVSIKSKPKIDPFSLQKNEIKLAGEDVYFDGDESDEEEEREENSDEDSEEEGEERKEKKEKRKWGGEYLSRVIYVGHLPFGFFEDQLEGYFSQYGEITKVMVKRNKYTKNSMGYGYIQFKNSDVAKIAAESMNNYLLYGRRLICELAKDPLGFSHQVENLVPIDNFQTNRDAHNKAKTPKQHKKRLSRLLKSEKERRGLLKKAGYKFLGYKAALPAKPKRVDLSKEAKGGKEVKRSVSKK